MSRLARGMANRFGASISGGRIVHKVERTDGGFCLSLTDHDGVWGAMEFAHACKGLGVKAITGASSFASSISPRTSVDRSWVASATS